MLVNQGYSEVEQNGSKWFRVGYATSIYIITNTNIFK